MHGFIMLVSTDLPRLNQLSSSLHCRNPVRVICYQKVGFQLKTRSGSHDYEGLSYASSDKPVFMLDLYNLRSVSVDMADESAWVQDGATLGELYYSIWKKSNVHGFPAGACPTVGVGGHISGGGYGTLMRKYGVSTDNVVDAKIVDVKGKIVDRKGMGEDLFWAIRGGGGGSFGVILAYKIKLATPMVLISRNWGLTKDNCTEMRWIDSVLWWVDFDLGTPPNALQEGSNKDPKFAKRKSDYVQTPLPRDGLESLWKKLSENGKVGSACNSYGWKMNEIKETETAFPHRAGNLYKIQYSVNWDEPGMEADTNYTNQAKAVHEFMTQFVSKNPRRAYLNYRDIDIGTAKTWSYEEGKAYGLRYFHTNYERLVDVKTKVVKTKVNPNNIFRNEQSIPPRSPNTN
ncbi:putative Reticuline oxidase precursor [Hibiscus syriacus]|uniref:Reticuline oxidase n=1 Tax=Hibiscus syriacus TaxID=106335 RepID=A0A6A2YGQ0_HIBSY|nr:putative Reticuline oxidase precursor [Hibiscus syriacus]